MFVELLFAGLLLFLFIFCMLSVCAWQNRKLRRQQADRDRYGRWICPDCGQPFGPDAFFVKYIYDHDIELQDRVFTRHVNIACPRCRLLNTFDPRGNHLFEEGTPFEWDEEEVNGLPAPSR